MAPRSSDGEFIDRIFDDLEQKEPAPVEYEERAPGRPSKSQTKSRSWRVPKVKLEGSGLIHRGELQKVRQEAAIWVRMQCGIGINKFARYLHISPATVQRIERDPSYSASGRIWARYHMMAAQRKMETEAALFKREALCAAGLSEAVPGESERII